MLLMIKVMGVLASLMILMHCVKHYLSKKEGSGTIAPLCIVAVCGFVVCFYLLASNPLMHGRFW